MKKKSLFDYVEFPPLGWQLSYGAQMLFILKAFCGVSSIPWGIIGFLWVVGLLLLLLRAAINKTKDNDIPAEHRHESCA